MADTASPPTKDECVTCHKRSTPENPLRQCGRCKTTSYCSVDCQKADWKTHKQRCASTTQATAEAQPNKKAGSQNTGSPGMNNNGSTMRSSGPLDVKIDKPFHKIHERKWLHSRTERDVYKLLIDTYRLRMDDDYFLSGKADVDSIYGAARDGKDGFRRFLNKVEKKPGLLPSWWSATKAQECVAFGSGQHPDYDLARRAGKQAIIDKYGDREMAMKLRLFGEQIYGVGPGGANGEVMLRMQMQIEEGNLGMFHSLMSLP